MDFTGITPFPSENVSVADTYFSLGSDCITVRKYISSHLESGSVHLAQDRYPSGEVVFFFENYFDGNLALLISNDPDPDIADQAEMPDISISIDHEEYIPAVNHGYMLIAGPFDAGCRIILSKAPFEECAEEAAGDDALEDDSFDNDAAVDDTIKEEVLKNDQIEQEELEKDQTKQVELENDQIEQEELDDAALDDNDYEDLLRVDGICAADIEDMDNNEQSENCEIQDEESSEEESGDSQDDPSPAVATGFSHTYEDAEILYSDTKRRYVLKIRDGNGAHAILPGGIEVFARTGEHAFKGYRMRIGDEEYDLVVMKESAVSEKAAGCNAYMSLLGSFQGDCCYCIDTSHPEKRGTHGILRGTAYIDNETGYKWGETTPGCYEFELENGSYNVYAISATPEGNINSKKDIRKVSGGFLKLYSGNEKFTHISITAADAVISENSSYVKLTPDEYVQEAAYLYIPEDISRSNDTPVADDTDATEEKAFRTAEFEHISTYTPETGDKQISPYVFDTFEVTDETVISHNPDKDEEEGKYRISEPPYSEPAKAEPVKVADGTGSGKIDVAIPLSRANIESNIRVSTYTVSTPEMHK
ncbi:MAG: hypothetical protein K6E62_09630, partial [Lachnospiraceae bacterium]|nr:hypothetical protein [Lachnospiraceae bacterium]